MSRDMPIDESFVGTYQMHGASDIPGGDLIPSTINNFWKPPRPLDHLLKFRRPSNPLLNIPIFFDPEATTSRVMYFRILHFRPVLPFWSYFHLTQCLYHCVSTCSSLPLLPCSTSLPPLLLTTSLLSILTSALLYSSGCSLLLSRLSFCCFLTGILLLFNYCSGMTKCSTHRCICSLFWMYQLDYIESYAFGNRFFYKFVRSHFGCRNLSLPSALRLEPLWRCSYASIRRNFD
jgi:hypothetical protein